MNVLKAWLRVSHKAEEAVATQLGRLSKTSALHPWKCVGLSLLLCLLCAVGFLRIDPEQEAENLWVDQHSEQMKNRNWVEDTFPSLGLPARMLITSKDGGNILTMTKMTEVFQIADDVRALVDDDGRKLEDLCLRVQGNCLTAGVVRYFGSTADFSTVSSDAEILAKVNSESFPDGGDAFPSDSMGGITLNAGGNVTGALAVRVDFLLDADKEKMLTWELTFAKFFTKNDLTEQKYEHVNVFVMAERSQDDELSRTVSADIPLFAVAFVLMGTFTSIFLGKPLSWTQSRRLLGLCEFYLVVFGSVAGYGVSMLMGVKFTVLHQILPFILVGIGIDDAFVISGAFDATDPDLSISDRMEKAVRRVGVSITLTKITSLASFLLGATSAFPSVQYFCIYAAVCCFFIWFLHLTAFCAMLALDARRAQAMCIDPLPCIRARASCLPVKEEQKHESRLGNGLAAMIRMLTQHWTGIVITLLLFLTVAGVSLWQVSLGLGTDFDITDLTPDQSYLREFYNEERRHFGGLSGGGLALPTQFYVKDVDFSTVDVQRSIEEAGAGIMDMKSINKDRGLKSWHTAFTLWANLNKGTQSYLPDAAFVAVPTNRTGCATGLLPGFDTCADHFLTGATFQEAVAEFLKTRMGVQFEDDVIFNSDGSIKVARLRATHVDTSNSRQQVDALEETEDFQEGVQGSLAGSFMSSPAYIFFDQFRIIVAQMTSSIGLCLGAVVVISALVLAHPLSVLVVLIALALVFMDLLGNIVLWDLDLNSISLINLVMAVGLVVDYSMHMAHNFSLQDASLPRAKRAELAAKEMGQPIFLGVTTTFLAILPLAFSSSQAFRVFFQMFFGIVLAGGAHGLIFMPVLLSVMGPSMNMDTSVENISNTECKDVNDEPESADKVAQP